MQITQQTQISPEAQQAKLRLGIIGNTPMLIEAVQRAITVAPIDLAVLVTGESGTGKEFFPQIIHQFSARKHSKYIAVNCGAIPEGTIDSELFGHEKGSFTGAVSDRKGYFEEANGGTIFLDEVAELPLTTQARLLRVLETGEFLKVGSSTVQKTNIRVVAATNVDMAQAVADGRFREDLYYRLSTVQITIPPLRERGGDITLLARKFASDFAERYRMPQITFSEDARHLLLSYRWPGNVRQLKNAVEQAALFCAGQEVPASELSKYLPADAPRIDPGAYSPTIRSNTYEREREMLFNLIFRLQRELDELRKRVDEHQAEKPKRHLPVDAPMPDDLPKSLVKVDHKEESDPNVMDVDASEMTITLEDSEREAIRRSLLRNDGRRALTAKELNISERTLYRKIKEYGLD
ncbi:MAG: sigma-54 dependent transcriptional regulator [Bacteroidales bacterium]|nr:sigma-54 dependent transcriptional regulator [Bacteroidales bacterium]MCD8386683.1 sigma-54 dependent transcriptional regulator [Bacteroidales bacterium]